MASSAAGCRRATSGTALLVTVIGVLPGAGRDPDDGVQPPTRRLPALVRRRVRCGRRQWSSAPWPTRSVDRAAGSVLCEGCRAQLPSERCRVSSVLEGHAQPLEIGGDAALDLPARQRGPSRRTVRAVAVRRHRAILPEERPGDGDDGLPTHVLALQAADGSGVTRPAAVGRTRPLRREAAATGRGRRRGWPPTHGTPCPPGRTSLRCRSR